MKANRDILWKDLMEEVFDDFLRFVFRAADKTFDMKKGFRFLDKEFAALFPDQDNATGTRHVDKLVSVYRRDGKEEWVLVHLEIQGETRARDRPLFSQRMFSYFYRVFDKYRRPIIAVAIFTGRDAAKLPSAFHYEYQNTRLHYEYNTLRILDYSDEDLTADTNPFALVMLIAKQALLHGKELDKTLLKGKLFVFRKLYEKGLFKKRNLQAILSFLNHYVHFDRPETNRIFNKEIDLITEKKNVMDIFERVALILQEEGKEEGLQKGRAEASRIIVENLLKEGSFKEKKIAELTNVPIANVRKIKKQLASK